jgi:hypothetical protein
MTKYNIYIICKDEETFKEKITMFKKCKSKICHIQWVPAEYLKITQCNKKLLKKLETRYNTGQKKILAKLGTIAAHRKALLAIEINQTDNNIILEADAELIGTLPPAPKVSCYMGGWIIPPQITKAGIIIPKVRPKKGLNEIDYDKFSVLMAHAYFIKKREEAKELFQSMMDESKIRNYDVHLIKERFMNHYYYPEIFVQGKHTSEIDFATNKNDQRTKNYGI